MRLVGGNIKDKISWHTPRKNFYWRVNSSITSPHTATRSTVFKCSQHAGPNRVGCCWPAVLSLGVYFLLIRLQYVLVKFLGTRKQNAERIGVLGIHFFGYEVKPNCPLNEDLRLVTMKNFVTSFIAVYYKCAQIRLLHLLFVSMFCFSTSHGTRAEGRYFEERSFPTHS